MEYFARIPVTVPVLGLIGVDAARALTGRARRVRVPRGGEVFRQGEPSRTVFFLEEGKAALLRRSSDGRNGIVALLGSGDPLGEVCALTLRPYAMSAKVVSDSTVLAVASQELTHWLEEYPSVLPKLMAVLARRTRCALDAVADRASAEVPARVARELLVLAERFGIERDGGIRVHHELTQDELAQLVGSCRETVNKALGDFSARGWIDVGARTVVILAPERLARRARTVDRPCTPRIGMLDHGHLDLRDRDLRERGAARPRG